MEVDSKGKVKLGTDEVRNLNNMIRGIAYRYNGWAGLRAEEDIIPVLWCKAMTMIRRKKTDITMNYIARGCYNGCIDLYDAKKKGNDHECTFEEDLMEAFTSKEQQDSTSDLSLILTGGSSYKGDGSDPEGSLLITDLMNLFPEGSAEQTYINLISKWVGLNNANPEDVGYKHKDYVIAKKCGYASDTSSGYRNFKYRVRDKIREFYQDSIGFELEEIL